MFKPNFSSLRLDLTGIYYIPKIIKASKLGDAAILREIIKILKIEKIKTISSLSFNPELTLKKGYYSKTKPNDYIELSGGLNEFADEKNIYVIKQNGSVMSLASSGGFFRGASNNLESGDTIVVPITVSTYSGLRATTEITQIIYQMALSAAAVNSF